jgi:hypothetical protein
MWPFRRKQPAPRPSQREIIPPISWQEPDQPDLPHNFGFKNTWWAVQSADTAAVIEAIGLRNAHPANWETGVRRAWEGDVFVTPPLRGWTLIVGTSLPKGEREPEQEILPQLLRLSEQFGVALIFASHRVSGYVFWAKAVAGALVRGYAYVDGDSFWDAGALTPEEHELGLRFFDDRSPESEDEAYWERDDLKFPDEMHVVDLARAWSVSPWYLEEEFHEKSIGTVGSDAALLNREA